MVVALACLQNGLRQVNWIWYEKLNLVAHGRVLFGKTLYPSMQHFKTVFFTHLGLSLMTRPGHETI